MADRIPIVGGNWKMNLHRAEAEALSGELTKAIAEEAVEVVVCPAFCYLGQVGSALEGGLLRLGAQDVYHEANGAFTGEISCSMLKDVGVEWVLTGHSERRHVIGENDVLINAKTRAALEAGLKVILCVGEKIEQREAGQTDAINIAQLHYGLAGVAAAQMPNVVIAYEPVWAIGTGKTATAEDAQSAHRAIRSALESMYDANVAQATRIQYGGSVKPANAAELYAQNDVDGFLVGGASLKSEDFSSIVSAAAQAVTTG
ncbi:MAG: triose-phosphate isomerase [Phycisphaeraceae bacterium]|nr:triose-phosphate isomerase [Phycisphaeraceae bacterium]